MDRHIDIVLKNVLVAYWLSILVMYGSPLVVHTRLN